MSLILDALNRSRQDADPVPGLGTQHSVETVSSGGRSFLPWIALSVALILIAWLLLDRGTASEEALPVTTPVAELSRNMSSAAAAVTSELKSRVAMEREIQAAASAAADDLEAGNTPVNVSAPTAGLAPDSAAEQVLVPDGVSPTRDNTAVADLYQQRTVPKKAAQPVEAPAAAPAVPGEQQPDVEATAGIESQEQPVDLEKLLLQARDDIKNESLVEHSAPFVTRLSQSAKDKIPTVLYQRHDYSNTKARSSVTLNGKSLRVGGSPAAGMKVDEILPDSVVLNYQGSQFRLRALNSWVNL